MGLSNRVSFAIMFQAGACASMIRHNEEPRIRCMSMTRETPSVAPAQVAADDEGEMADEPHSHDLETLQSLVISSLENSKAEDIVTIPLDPAAALADVMIIASGRSSRHVSAIADRLMDDLQKAGWRNFSVEGLETADWVLLDLGDVIVHVFRPEVRELYNLEKLWSPHAPRQEH